MSKQNIIICRNFPEDLARVITHHHADKLFILTDEETHLHCLPLLNEVEAARQAEVLVIGTGDGCKTLDTLSHVWQRLSDGGATRHSLLINLGGGMVTDLGGFAAASFKRGLHFVNVPTTLLAMVDASVGGKTGINFNGLKNEIGVFSAADSVLIETGFLHTLDVCNFLSGYAEMLKHGLISTNEHWQELLRFDVEEMNPDALKTLVEQSIRIKEEIVEIDPCERGIRKALNLGHTVGHAFESLALERQKPVLHGYAVAWGMVCELYLSAIKLNFPNEKLRCMVQYVKEHYGAFAIDCTNYDRLYALMKHDKKNAGDTINFTLLGDVGEIELNQTASKNEIEQMFDFYRECMGM